MSLDIIAMTESINIKLDNYSIEHTPTKIAVAGASLYINKSLSYHPRNYLNIYMPGKLESIFFEIVCSKSSNVIIGCIYKYPSL